jgi:hypothetical protein
MGRTSREQFEQPVQIDQNQLLLAENYHQLLKMTWSLRQNLGIQLLLMSQKVASATTLLIN